MPGLLLSGVPVPWLPMGNIRVMILAPVPVTVAGEISHDDTQWRRCPSLPGRHCPTMTNSLFQNNLNMEVEAAIEMALHPGLDETGLVSVCTKFDQTQTDQTY